MTKNLLKTFIKESLVTETSASGEALDPFWEKTRGPLLPHEKIVHQEVSSNKWAELIVALQDTDHGHGGLVVYIARQDEFENDREEEADNCLWGEFEHSVRDLEDALDEFRNGDRGSYRGSVETQDGGSYPYTLTQDEIERALDWCTGLGITRCLRSFLHPIEGRPT